MFFDDGLSHREYSRQRTPKLLVELSSENSISITMQYLPLQKLTKSKRKPDRNSKDKKVVQSRYYANMKLVVVE